MKLFGFNKKKEESQVSAKAHSLNVTKEGIVIDGTLIAPLTIDSLSNVLGEPRIVPPENLSPNDKGRVPNYVVVWDNAGIEAYTKDIEKGEIGNIELLLFDDPEWLPAYDKAIYNPRSPFSGTFLINGKPLLQALPEKTLQNAYIFVEAKVGGWQLSLTLPESLQREIRDGNRNKENAAEIIRNADRPFSQAAMWYKEVRVSTGKYNHKKPQGEVLAFKNLNFKLAIVQELMYNQHLIEPAFDVYDFAGDYAKREIDIDGEGYEVIPEVKKWFQTLPVSATLAEKVETLYLDGGNDVYLQICPLWDGEDGIFNIKAIAPEELAQFPNLKRIETPGIELSANVRKLLATKGIDVIDC